MDDLSAAHRTRACCSLRQIRHGDCPKPIPCGTTAGPAGLPMSMPAGTADTAGLIAGLRKELAGQGRDAAPAWHLSSQPRPAAAAAVTAAAKSCGRSSGVKWPAPWSRRSVAAVKKLPIRSDHSKRNSGS